MLQAQVNYWTLQENKRHNLESEKLGFNTLAETTRHNIATEGLQQANIDLGYANLDESHRHNLATESISWANLAENRRHNERTERIGTFEAQTGAINAETRKQELDLKERQYTWDVFHGTDTYNLDSRKTSATEQQADAALQNAETNEKKMWFNLVGDAIKTSAKALSLLK